jgi:hypothetical protein
MTTESTPASAEQQTDTTASQEPQTETTYTQADLDRARAEGEQAGRQAGAQAETEWAAQILAYAEECAATLPFAHACIRQRLSAEQAKAVLASARGDRAAGRAAADTYFGRVQ